MSGSNHSADFNKFAALHRHWMASSAGCEWKTPEEAWDWLTKRGWRFGWAGVKRKTGSLPWGPGNCVIVQYGPDGAAQNPLKMETDWDECVARFKGRLAQATEKGIERMITKWENGTLFE